MISSKHTKLKQDSIIPDVDLLESFSVKIECKDEKGVSNNGTGTIFSDGISYYVITAAHSIQYGATESHFHHENIKASLPHRASVTIRILEVLMFDLKDEVDFALLKASLQSPAKLPVNYHDDFGIVGEDNFGQNLCVYGYTDAYTEGNSFKMRHASSDRYTIDENITASCKDFAHTMKGSSGGGIHVVYENKMYCVGIVKGRDKASDKLDQVYYRRIPNINEKLHNPVWIPSLLDNEQGLSAGSNSVEILYNKYWNEVDNGLSKNEDISGALDNVSELRKSYPYIKSVARQESIINRLIRKQGKWTEPEQRTFIYAIQDRGLWLSLFGKISQFNEEISDIPELRQMILRASTYALGTEEGELKFDETCDSDIYELVLRYAFSFDFDNMYEKVRSWHPSGVWVAKKALLINLFEKNDESLKALASYIDEKNNPPTERFVASLIYNVSCQAFPVPIKYEEYWNKGIDSPSEIIAYIANRIDNKKIVPTIYGVHTTPLFGSTDSTSFPEALRLLQYIVNAGLTTKFGIFNIVNVEHWMKAFRHLIYFIPYPTIYYTLQYADEKTVRWAGQMIAYRDDEFMNGVRPDILVSLLKAMRMEHIPRYVYMGLCYMTQELYSSVPEDKWYDEFKESVFDRFVNKIPIENVSSSDVIFKNILAALPCIRNIERREYVFVALSSVMERNPILISRLICSSLWVDKELSALEKVKGCLWNVINNTPISRSYNVFCAFSRVGTLSEDLLSAIDKKIVDEDLKFAKSDYPAIINLSNLVVSEAGINKIKQTIKGGDIWNCGITDSYYTDPMPFHIEMLNEKVQWTEEDWEKIKSNMEHNLSLVESHKETGTSSNFYNCMYIDLLSDMKLFLVRLKNENGINTDEIISRIDTDIKHLLGFGNLMEALSSDDYNKVSVALDLLNVSLKNDSFDNYKQEIQLIIMKVVLMQSANIDKCISFLACLMYDYRTEMIANFGSSLILMLKNYCDYDFEKFNFNVPTVNHWFSLIANQMKPEYAKEATVRYWTSESVVRRFGNVGIDTINISVE